MDYSGAIHSQAFESVVVKEEPTLTGQSIDPTDFQEKYIITYLDDPGNDPVQSKVEMIEYYNKDTCKYDETYSDFIADAGTSEMKMELLENNGLEHPTVKVRPIKKIYLKRAAAARRQRECRARKKLKKLLESQTHIETMEASKVEMNENTRNIPNNICEKKITVNCHKRKYRSKKKRNELAISTSTGAAKVIKQDINEVEQKSLTHSETMEVTKGKINKKSANLFNDKCEKKTAVNSRKRQHRSRKKRNELTLCTSSTLAAKIIKQELNEISENNINEIYESKGATARPHKAKQKKNKMNQAETSLNKINVEIDDFTSDKLHKRRAAAARRQQEYRSRKKQNKLGGAMLSSGSITYSEKNEEQKLYEKRAAAAKRQQEYRARKKQIAFTFCTENTVESQLLPGESSEVIEKIVEPNEHFLKEIEATAKREQEYRAKNKQNKLNQGKAVNLGEGKITRIHEKHIFEKKSKAASRSQREYRARKEQLQLSQVNQASIAYDEKCAYEKLCKKRAAAVRRQQKCRAKKKLNELINSAVFSEPECSNTPASETQNDDIEIKSEIKMEYDQQNLSISAFYAEQKLPSSTIFVRPPFTSSDYSNPPGPSTSSKNA